MGQSELLGTISAKLAILSDGEPFDVEDYIKEEMKSKNIGRTEAIKKLADRFARMKVF